MCRIIRAAKTPREKGVGVALLDISLHRYVQAHSSRSLTPGKLRRSVPLIATPKNLRCASVPFASQRRPGVLASWRLGGQSLSLRRLIAPGTTPCCEVRCWGGGAPLSFSPRVFGVKPNAVRLAPRRRSALGLTAEPQLMIPHMDACRGFGI